jgi:endonuclease YncB( thermonuclease family)
MGLSVPIPLASACDLAHETSQVVTAAESADTLRLDDGGEVVLIGALPPTAIGANDGQQPWPPSQDGRTRLAALAVGKTVDLAFSGRRLDRYGRRLAHVFVQTENGQLWLQGDLIEAGLSRAYALPGNEACMEELLAREAIARSTLAGHWATGVFQDRDATATRDLEAYRDTFQTVEGRVTTVRAAKGRQTLAFAEDATDGRSFTSVVPPPSKVRRGQRGSRDLSSLEGKHVRVRGWIEMRRGPVLMLTSPDQIERLEPPPGR